MNPDSETRTHSSVLCVGASVRFVCGSLRRGGWTCEGADLFADWETRLAGESRRVREYPTALLEAVSQSSCRYWLYTGGLENYSDRFPCDGPELLGVGPREAAPVRDPFVLRAVLDQDGFAMPEMRRDPPADQTGWLNKSVRSCGGLGVVDARDADRKGLRPGDHYFQQRISGEVWGAVYAASDASTELLGVTAAFGEGDSWTAAGRYQYSGSWGPLPLTKLQRVSLRRLGETLANRFLLRGVFGVDLVWDETLGAVVLEVNPRIPASSEVLERAWQYSIGNAHVGSFLARSEPVVNPIRADARSGLWGKAIVYATEDCDSARLRHEAAASWEASLDHWLADTPANGGRIVAGRPIATVFARAEDSGALRRRLRELAERIRRRCLVAEL